MDWKLLSFYQHSRPSISQTAGMYVSHVTSFHVPLYSAYVCTQFSLPPWLFGSPPCQFVYVSAAPVTLDTNVPSVVASVPSIYIFIVADLPANKKGGRSANDKCSRSFPHALQEAFQLATSRSVYHIVFKLFEYQEIFYIKLQSLQVRRTIPAAQ